jgi:prepilin-type N-terminal cleavage/methylation domain-containing protein
MRGVRGISAGYSLVELLVVLAIMSLIVLVAIPAASSTVERMTLSADARALTTELRVLRTAAMDRQTDVAVTATNAAHILGTSAGAPIELSSGTAAEVSHFTLHWDGTATGAIQLKRGDSIVRVSVDRLTGRLAVESVR